MPNVGIGTESPDAKLTIQDGAVLLSGTTGNTPASGAGTRLMWIPSKAAFRAGRVYNTEWDDANIGNYSLAIGESTTASGIVSTAIGASTTATGSASTAMGSHTTASGDKSTTMGYQTTASGSYSTALGNNTTAESHNQTTIGRHNKPKGGENAGSWIATDPLFVVGNGTSSILKSNAMMILKNGNTAIGNVIPDSRLDIDGALTQRGMASAPAVSPAGQGRIYFDSGSNTFKVSQDGSAYTDLVSAGGDGSGTVTEVTSANSYISVANTTTTPQITANVGTTANTLAAGDDSRIVGALQAADFADAKSCTDTQTIYWDTISDKWACQDINTTTAGGFFKDGGNSLGADATLGTNDNYALNFEAKGATQMTIRPEGVVGIGTEWPWTKLEVVGDFATSGGIYNISNLTRVYTPTGATVSPNPLASDGNFIANNNNSSTDGNFSTFSFAVTNAASKRQRAYIGAVSNPGAATYTPEIVIGHQTGSSSYSERVRINSSGYVGIGTETPDSALTVNGAIVSRSVSSAAAYINFNAGNTQMSSTTATTINICGMKDGGNYTLVLTDIDPNSVVTINAYPVYDNSSSCSGTPIQVDLGGGENTFLTAGNTNILTFVYFSGRGANGTVYGMPATNYNY